MTRLKLLGLMLAAVFVSGAALATTAMALEVPENLPALKAGEKRSFTGKAVGKTEFRAEGQPPVKCETAKGTSTETVSKPPEGEFAIEFEKCTSEFGIPVSCTGLGDPNGVIKVAGTWKLVFDREVNGAFNLTTAVLFKNKPVHFTCAGFILVEVLAGETLCLHLEPTSKKATHEFHCFGPKTGTTPIEEYSLTDLGTFKKPDLKSSVNHEPEVPSIQIGLGTTTGPEIFADQ